MSEQHQRTNSFHLVDADLKKHIEHFPVGVDLNASNLQMVRESLRKQIRPIQGDLPVEVSEHYVPGPPGAPDVRVLLFQPLHKPTQRPGYLHIHGGGMVMGSPEAEQIECEVLCAELGCTVVSVDYRLSPETCHPGPVEDCYAALKWLFANGQELGVDPERIAIGGGSAGGGLAAALAILARDRNEMSIIFQRLQFPMLDDRTCVAERSPYNGEYLWTRGSNYFGWKSLLGHEPGIEGVSPYASPAREENLAGLPAAFISIGAIDLFAEESIDYAKRLICSGVSTELHMYPGVPHGFGMVQEARVTQAETHTGLEALRRAFYG